MKRIAPALVPFLAPVIAITALIGLGYFFAPVQAEAQPGRALFGNNISAGLDAWKSGGYKSAVRRWMDDSPLGKDPAVAATLNTELAAVERAYGKPSGYNTIHTLDLTSNIRVIYVGVHLEDGPFFMRFLSYKKQRGGWIVSEIDYNVSIDPLLTPLLNPGAQ